MKRTTFFHVMATVKFVTVIVYATVSHDMAANTMMGITRSIRKTVMALGICALILD